MGMNRWKMNKLGFVNFWLYDHEEFQIKDGHILLRGDNASGKSITTQSFIPFLLDGNKSPERLDPFGSRDRKMEFYLLGDGEREESTGYLYLEFKKADTEAYLTIGVGMRAQKGKGIDFWGFCLCDGRRIGTGGVSLYEKIGGQMLPLSKQNIKAIRKGVPAPKIKAKILGEGGVEWLVHTLLYSAQDNKETLKEMKNDVVPSVLTDSEWKDIVERIKVELKENSYIRIIPGATDTYQLTAYPSTPEEKQLYVFRNETSFYGKAEAVLNALQNPRIEKTSDAFMEMVSYFQDQLASEKTAVSERIASVLILDYLSEKEVPVTFDVSFESLYHELDESEKKEVFASLDNTTLKKEFVDHLIDADKPAAPATLVSIFPIYISSYIPNKLRRLNKGADYYALIRRSVESFRDCIPSFIFFSCEANLSEQDMKKAEVTEDQIFRTKLLALSHVTKAQSTAETKKNVKVLRKNLVDDRTIDKFISKASRELIDEMRPLILFNEGLETEEKTKYRNEILNRFPDFDFNEAKKEAPKPAAPKVVSGFLCTQRSYDRKKEELKDINTVQMPEILKEINFARELGDLRENSE